MRLTATNLFAFKEIIFVMGTGIVSMGKMKLAAVSVFVYVWGSLFIGVFKIISL